MMGTQYNSKTVSNGLILYIDAANNRSYPGSGNTWYDLSGNSRNILLYNTPTFTPSNLGTIDFDATSVEFGTFTSPSSITNFTCEAWIRVNTAPASNTVQAIVTQTYPGTSSKINYSLGFNGANGSGAYDGKINGGFYDGTWRLTGGFTPTVGVWYHTAVTYNGTTIIQYQNGVSQSTLNYSGTPTGSGGSSYIMRRWDDPNMLDGNLAMLKIYNRALSSLEVLANYKSTLGRFFK